MKEKVQSIRLFGTADDSIVDGPGLRFSVFTQGCSHHCPGCHNPESQDFSGGYLISIDDLERQIVDNRLISGVTFSGGEPFDQCEECLELATRLKQRGYNIWIYSGYTLEELMAGKPHSQAPELLRKCDVLVDGVFKQELHAYDLQWRGSSNQRLIDLNKTFTQGKVQEWESYEEFPKAPPSW